MLSRIKIAALLLISSCAGHSLKNVHEKPEPSGRMGLAEVGKKCVASEGAPKIAIIIDDIGKYENDIEPFLALGIPLTFSILPGQPFSPGHSVTIKTLGYEQMLHIPLEPEDSGKIDDENILTTEMNDSEIAGRIEFFFEKFPQISGVNQHMGSKFSQDREKMRVLLGEVKKRGLYFIDSRTTEKTVAYELALEMGIASASRDVFLDNSRDANEILLS
ncbi:MAG: divergent polysaccharide deacetylase family protein, partial [Deltaproteobacteria bacterium]|nr:divergent polysaccharide deacetylase family protein [Deltaproteobacteria bacterium]